MKMKSIWAVLMSHMMKRINITFKVPTLRNISQTAPYFHNGEAKTLKDAIKLMMEFQLGIRPDEESINKIIAFLKSLKGETPKIMKINE